MNLLCGITTIWKSYNTFPLQMENRISLRSTVERQFKRRGGALEVGRRKGLNQRISRLHPPLPFLKPPSLIITSY